MADNSTSAPSTLTSNELSNASDEETDWPSQITSSIVGYIDQVREKTTKPAIVASRALVFGLLILMFIPVALVLLLVGILRAVEVLFRFIFELDAIGVSTDHAVWSAYLLLGLILLGAGAFIFKKRKIAA